ncbi:YicC family protein [Skermanella rosea]|uniref:YicC/YloC family endoribonuclease n=1 Tax=Skermanella rosea TaxID=1817965 RepID=UPI0019313445|nr:YicC/YloC family endoribonuclease [Skermanella rosea]UEM05268.1 YicC family protein [Skermanella rosea]
MTGFARAEGRDQGYAWTFEIKSVNSRNLDLRCRLAPGFDALEPVARTAVPQRVRRGSVNVSLAVTRTAAPNQIRINRELLDQLIALAAELGGTTEKPRLDALLAVRGVVETVEDADFGDDRERLEAAMAATLQQALDSLGAVRLAEGTRLVEVLNQHLNEIARLTDQASACAALQPDALRQKLRGQVAALLDAVPSLTEERLAQEAALLITRADVREELDRLRAHVAAARDMLAKGGAIGRQLDFLCQEFNREANTLCSKSSDVELTRTGLALKAAIEQLREQAQNIE